MHGSCCTFISIKHGPRSPRWMFQGVPRATPRVSRLQLPCICLPSAQNNGGVSNSKRASRMEARLKQPGYSPANHWQPVYSWFIVVQLHIACTHCHTYTNWSLEHPTTSCYTADWLILVSLPLHGMHTRYGVGTSYKNRVASRCSTLGQRWSSTVSRKWVWKWSTLEWHTSPTRVLPIHNWRVLFRRNRRHAQVSATMPFWIIW